MSILLNLDLKSTFLHHPTEPGTMLWICSCTVTYELAPSRAASSSIWGKSYSIFRSNFIATHDGDGELRRAIFESAVTFFPVGARSCP